MKANLNEDNFKLIYNWTFSITFLYPVLHIEVSFRVSNVGVDSKICSEDLKVLNPSIAAANSEVV